MIITKSKWTILFALLIIFLSLGSVVYANDDAPVSEMFDMLEDKDSTSLNQGISNDPSPSLGGLLLRTVVVLGIIVGLIYFLSKWISKKTQSFEINQYMSIKAGINLGQNKSLRLVKIGSSYYLLGIGNDVRLLKEFSSEDEIADIESFQSEKENAANVYSNSVQSLLALFSKKDREEDRSFQTQLEDRLSDLRRNPNSSKDKHQDREGLNL